MKITKKQREQIIKNVIRIVKTNLPRWNEHLCLNFEKELSGLCQRQFTSDNCNEERIQEYIPRFKKSIAIKYFKGGNNYSWWDNDNYEINNKNRLEFLNYLLTGKLPKKKVKK